MYDVDLLNNKLLITRKDFEVTQLRRLSTESYVNSSNPLATEWIWYWQDENGLWRMYDQDHTVSMEKSWYLKFSTKPPPPLSNKLPPFNKPPPFQEKKINKPPLPPLITLH